MFFKKMANLMVKLILKKLKRMIPPRIELMTFCVLGRRDNRYTTESYRSKRGKAHI